MIHTGDITHLSKPAEFDDAEQHHLQARLDVHYVPGEHDIIDRSRSSTTNATGGAPRAPGWYSFDANGVHFIGWSMS